MIRRSTGFIFPLLLLWLSCVEKDSRNSDEINVYYSIKGLVEQQLAMLDSISPSLIKIAEINGKTEKGQLVPDSLGWVRELEMLHDLDLNEPNLVSAYLEENTMNGSDNSISYSSIDPAKTRVDQLTIRFDAASALPVSLEATISDSNPLFKIFRTLHFRFSESAKLPLINSYSISGWQKMILMDTNRFKINCEVIRE